MLNVDAMLRKKKIRLVLALLRRGQIVLIGGFVLVEDSVEIEEICNFTFLETAKEFTLKRSDVVLAYIVEIPAPILEFVRAFVGSEAALKPFNQNCGDFAVCKQVSNNFINLFREGPAVLSCNGQRRTFALDFTDDCHAKTVKCGNLDVTRRFGFESSVKALPHLIAGIACERKQQQFRWLQILSLDEPSCLGNDNGCFAAAGCSNHKIVALIRSDRLALFIRKRVSLYSVEQKTGANQLGFKVSFVGFFPSSARSLQEFKNVLQQLNLGNIGQCFWPSI